MKTLIYDLLKFTRGLGKGTLSIPATCKNTFIEFPTVSNLKRQVNMLDLTIL